MSIAADAGPKPSLILVPGLPSLKPGHERYRIAGGGTLAVVVKTGDIITVVDVEGLQPCELADAGLLGIGGQAGEGLKQALASDAAATTRALLKRHRVDIARLKAVRVFGGQSRAGDSATFTVHKDGLLIACAPGGIMDAEKQDTATPISLTIARAAIPNAAADIALPDPLSDPLQDFRVARASAMAYRVKAGEFIQVIDVAGRQMTDFQCFSVAKLDKGIENALDATVTRTLTGRSYPAPGLTSKLFGRDFEPMVEIIQDTVGRHDFFATACNSRYYDDAGYPGHVNCTGNFNKALEPYGIAPRKGWEALNYFYNTRINEHNQIYFDESWSRPGDYVLMRALTDLVCVTSACPDDIDPGNGWNPTDIHVRTYGAAEKFTRAIATRMTPDAEPQMTRETSFHERFSALTRNLTEYRGYWLPSRFNNEGPIEEYWACRERVAVIDLSPLRKFEVTGPDAEALLDYCVTRDISRLSPGQVVYTAMCYEHGGMIDDGTVFRLGQNNFRWIGGDEFSGLWLRQQAEKMGFKAWVRSSTDQLHNIAVQGPRSRDLLKEIVWTSPAQTALAELEWFRFAIGRIGDFEGIPIVVSRTGYTGELGYEIFCHPRDSSSVFDAVWAAGEKFGLKPLGLEALDMLRIEAGLIFWHSEFTDQTDPFEAGIGFTVPMKTKARNFIGKQALAERKDHPRNRLVGLEIDSNEAVGNGDCIHVGRAQIGTVTSATRSPILNKNIGLARVDVTHSAIGTEVEIGKLDGHQKRLPARIVGFPHYDPKKQRVRA